MFVTVCVHLFYAGLLLWLALVRLMPPLPENDEGSRTRIEFVGTARRTRRVAVRPAATHRHAPATSSWHGEGVRPDGGARRCILSDRAGGCGGRVRAGTSGAAGRAAGAGQRTQPGPADYVLPPTAIAAAVVAPPDVKLPEARAGRARNRSDRGGRSRLR
jgi:hypothetical protein